MSDEMIPPVDLNTADLPELTQIQHHLVSLQNASAKERKQLIAELEQQGNQVLFSHMVYTIVDGAGQQHRLGKKWCPQCKKELLLSEFFGTKNVQPWCNECRSLDPVGAKVVRDKLLQRHYPIEKRREKEKRQKEKHPQWGRRSDAHIQTRARTLAVKILEENMQGEVAQLADEYTLAQRRKILAEIQVITQQIEQLPAQQAHARQIATSLRAQAEELLRQAKLLEGED